MSIGSELRRLVKEETLWCVEPFPGDTAARTILISDQLNSFFEGAAQSDRIGQLWASLLGVVAGGQVTMSFVPFRHRDATFGVLDPIGEHTWEFRSRAPAPGLRLFGRFADIDTFIAVDWWPRSVPLEGFDKQPLGIRNSLQYQFAQIEVEQFWNQHLSNVASISGSSCSDFFSSKCDSI